METKNIIFWNVDTQNDFIKKDGKLYVQNAELITGNLAKLTQLAAKYKIKVVNTADYHYSNSAELDENPDYVHTFPEHCMAGTSGANYIKETNPENPLIFDWNKAYNIEEELNKKDYRNIVIRKDAFDVFVGSQHTEEILRILNPDIVIIYGVTTNVCVDYAATGLIKRVRKVYVVKDAIKELPNIGLPYKKWESMGVEMIELKEVKKIITC